jgi:hypothetical protein
MMIEAGVGDLVRRIKDDQAQVRYSMVGRLRGQVTPYVIRIVHVEEMRNVDFSVCASKQVVMVW